jgi:signal transduction histidine kinase
VAVHRGHGVQANDALAPEAVMRADKIIHGLLDLARPLSLQIGCHDLNHLIDQALALAIKQHSMKSIDIVKDFTHESAKVTVDQGQIQQVFINLISNSMQAMPQGGRLTLRTYPKQVKETDSGVGRRATDFFRVGERVIVCEIEDTGTGIAADKISKIFNPFFTTKPRGEGTGLGLSLVRTVVEAHRGLLSVRSQEGRGTLFTIILPTSA